MCKAAGATKLHLGSSPTYTGGSRTRVNTSVIDVVTSGNLTVNVYSTNLGQRCNAPGPRCCREVR